ncbi:TPA: hypothetical protein ACN70W_003813 [Klebsiella pneumoniae]
MTKSTITRERLEWLSQISCRDDIEDIGGDEIRELASIALAAMDSEPVAEVVSIYGDPEAFGEREIRPLVGIQQMPYGTKLYRHAQPAPVVPEEATPDSIEILASARRRDHAVFQWDEDQRNAAADSWNAFRAAMLQELKKSAGTEAICRSDENAGAARQPSGNSGWFGVHATALVGIWPGHAKCRMPTTSQPDCGKRGHARSRPA